VEQQQRSCLGQPASPVIILLSFIDDYDLSDYDFGIVRVMLVLTADCCAEGADW